MFGIEPKQNYNDDHEILPIHQQIVPPLTPAYDFLLLEDKESSDNMYSLIEVQEEKKQSEFINMAETEKDYKKPHRNLLSNESSSSSESSNDIDPGEVDRLLEDIEANKVNAMTRILDDREYYQPAQNEFQIGSMLWGAKPLPSARSTVFAEDDPHIQIS